MRDNGQTAELVRLLRQADPGIQVVGEAANGDEGRALVLKQLPISGICRY